jgi:transcriptional regulator with XRE-family HTH domain
MPANLSPPQPIFATQLNRVIGALRPDGVRVSDARVAEVVGVSARYIGQLRRGERTHPNDELVAALAGFFRVDVRFFTDAEVAAVIGGQLDIIDALGGPELRGMPLGPDPEVVADFAAAAALLERARRRP